MTEYEKIAEALRLELPLPRMWFYITPGLKRAFKAKLRRERKAHKKNSTVQKKMSQFVESYIKGNS